MTVGTSAPAVAIIDEHPITAVGIAVKLVEYDFTVAGVESAVEDLRSPCDAVVCGLRLPGRCGPDAVAYLVQHGHRVLATSGAVGAEEILDVIASGARGFVPKAAPVPAFMQAIRDVTDGSYFVSPELASLLLADAKFRPLGDDDIGPTEFAVLRRFEKGESASEVAAALGLTPGTLAALLAAIWTRARTRRAALRPSPRERQLMDLVAQGCGHKEAAARMSITTLTVAGYLKSIKGKYLAVHPGVSESISPLAVARRWADEWPPIVRCGVDTQLQI
jgi:two-component system response regulator DesR